MSTSTPGWVPDDRPPLEVGITQHDDDRSELTFYPADAQGFELMSQWITADEASVIPNVEDCR